MKEKLTDLRGIITNNWGLKLVSLILAFTVWITVTNSNDPIRSITISNVPINIVNADSIEGIGKVVELQGSGTVTLKVTERRSILNKLSRNGSNFTVEADLENINAMNAVPLSVTCDNSQVSWDEIALSPSSLKVTLEDKVEQTFLVNVETSGDPMDGYAVNKAELTDGKSVLIAGPETLINIINQVTATVTVSGLTQDADDLVDLHIYDKNGAEFTETQMSRLEIKDMEGNILTNNLVNVHVSIWQVENEIPIRIVPSGTPLTDYYVREIVCLPSAIGLKGTPEALEQIGDEFVIEDMVDVTARSESFSAEIDLNEILDQMEDVALLNDTDPLVNVEVSIERTGDRTLEIPLSDLELLNQPEDKKLVFTPADKVPILIHSETMDVQDIDPADIHGSIDLSVCEKEGNYEIPVDFELPDGCYLSEDVILRVSSVDQDEEPET